MSKAKTIRGEESESDLPEEHPSYGMIGLSRVSGGDGVLHGCSVRHHNQIRLRIAHGSYERDLSHDWYRARREIIEVAMSPDQFVTLITTMNCGDGVPCTIKHIDHERMPPPPAEDKRELFNREFKAQAGEMIAKLRAASAKAETMRDGKAPTKAERAEIFGLIESAITDLTSNLPWLEECFREQMEKSVTEAKASVEAFVLDTITRAGLGAIAAGWTPPAIDGGRGHESGPASLNAPSETEG